MPRGPKGERRPADVIGAAVKIMRIATGEELEDFGPETGKDKAAAELGRKSRRKRAETMTAGRQPHRRDAGDGRGVCCHRRRLCLGRRCRSWRAGERQGGHPRARSDVRELRRPESEGARLDPRQFCT